MNKYTFVGYLVAGLFCTNTSALTPAVTPDYELFISSSSTYERAFENIFNRFCSIGTFNIYESYDSSYGYTGLHKAYFCRVDINQVKDKNGLSTYYEVMQSWQAAHPDSDLVTPGYQGTMPAVLFHVRYAGLSAQSVTPVIDETAVTHMVINNGNCAVVSGTTYGCSFTNSGDTTGTRVLSDVGISDVNPEMIVGQNVPSGLVPVDATVVAAKMIVMPVTAILLGIPVSEPLYRALQRVQGKTVGLDDEANMPSLSKAEVASIMSGKVANWNVFKAGPAGQGLRDYAVSLGATAPASNLVQICRHRNGNSPQALMSAKFLNYPCTAGANASASGGSPALGPVISLGSSSGSVDNCLDGHGDNNRWAIGVQNMDTNNYHYGYSNLSYRFVKIDGVAPTLVNVANGKYLYWAESTYIWRRIGGSAAPANQLYGDKLDLVYTTLFNLASPDVIRDSMNIWTVYPFGQSGALALGTNPYFLNVPSYPFVNTNPVTPYNHHPSNNVNNCITPILVSTAGM